MMVALLSGAYLALLWIISSVLRGKGILVFGLGCVLLVGALVALRFGRRVYFLRLLFGVALVGVTVLGVEAALWVAPGLLSGRVANAALSGYQPDWDGIYVPDLYVGETMKASFRRHMYWNGHWWHHQTNSHGFRGPEISHADVVLLGDSLIYGHGVDQEETVSAQLEDLSGCVVANLGRQGASLVQELELLRRLGLPLSPRVIIVSSHPNDLADAVERYPVPELERFLHADGYRPLAIQPDPSKHSIFDWWLIHVALPMRSARALHALMRRPSNTASEIPMEPGPFVPTTNQMAEAFDPSTSPEARLGWEVHLRALHEIKREADAAGARMVMMDLGYPEAFSAAVREAADQLGVTYSDAGHRALDRALAGEPIYLPQDGHWTPLGSHVVAEGLAQSFDPCVR